MPPIVFYFPYPWVGGVSVLFLRLARKLAPSVRVYLMDLSDGYMASNLPPGCQFIPFDKPELIPSSAVVIFQSVPPWRIKNLEAFPRDAKVFFWNLHPYNLSPRLIQKGSRFEALWLFDSFNNALSIFRASRLKRLCLLMLSKNSLVFMDEENRKKTGEELEISLSRSYLPITTESAPNIHELSTRSIPKEKLKVAWVGRLDDFKIPILLHTLSRLNDVTCFNIEFDVIGDGGKKNTVVERSDCLDRLKVNFKGNVNYTELDRILLQYHLVFAMGTSALDSARLGIPTVVLDYSYSEIIGYYKYRLLRTSTGYNVAEEISQQHMELVSSLDGMLQDIVNNYEQESKFTYSYWLSNHSPEAVSKLFLEYSSNATATFGDLVDAGLNVPDFLTKIVCFMDRRKSDGSGFIRR